LRTDLSEAGATTSAEHPNGACLVDHVVATTPDPDRTIGVLRQAGLEPRRTREAGEIRQTFFRLGEVILELIGPQKPSHDLDDPARLWGLALNVTDLDALAAQWPEAIGRVKDAVQPGRRITTVRREAGVGVPLAFMSA
jgi:hypothetical protein